MREALDAVARGIGHPFPVKFSGWRRGDIIVSVAAAKRIRELLDRTPEFENLAIIIGHALAWEHKLLAMDLTATHARAIGEAISA